MRTRLKKEIFEFKLLIKSVPTTITVIFIMSVISMNLLANKSISLPVDWLALDCGIIVSWVSFLVMDVVTKHFGAKAATEMSLFAVIINLIFCLFMFLGSLIPGVWGESYVDGSQDVIISALDKTFGGTWYVVLGSTVAFVTSSFVNNFSNYAIGKLCKKKPDGFLAYVLRSYISTALGQFLDNFVFALIVSHVFFGWSILQCVTCSLTGMVAELVCEAVFSYPGYAVCRKWKTHNVGKEYFDYLGKSQKEGK